MTCACWWVWTNAGGGVSPHAARYTLLTRRGGGDHRCDEYNDEREARATRVSREGICARARDSRVCIVCVRRGAARAKRNDGDDRRPTTDD